MRWLRCSPSCATGQTPSPLLYLFLLFFRSPLFCDSPSHSVCAAGHCNCWAIQQAFHPKLCAADDCAWPLPQVPPAACLLHSPACPIHLACPVSLPLSNEPWLLLLQRERFLCVPLSKIEFQIIFTALTRLAPRLQPPTLVQAAAARGT